MFCCSRVVAQRVKLLALNYEDSSSDLQHLQQARCSTVLMRQADAMTDFKLAVKESRPENLASPGKSVTNRKNPRLQHSRPGNGMSQPPCLRQGQWVGSSLRRGEPQLLKSQHLAL